jgi:hypothetical protein
MEAFLRRCIGSWKRPVCSSNVIATYSNKGTDRFDERVDSIGKRVDLA